MCICYGFPAIHICYGLLGGANCPTAHLPAAAHPIARSDRTAHLPGDAGLWRQAKRQRADRHGETGSASMDFMTKHAGIWIQEALRECYGL